MWERACGQGKELSVKSRGSWFFDLEVWISMFYIQPCWMKHILTKYQRRVRNYGWFFILQSTHFLSCFRFNLGSFPFVLRHVFLRFCVLSACMHWFLLSLCRQNFKNVNVPQPPKTGAWSLWCGLCCWCRHPLEPSWGSFSPLWAYGIARV